MFGPDSGQGSWNNLNFMYDKVRIGTDAQRQQRAAALLQVTEGQAAGLRSDRDMNAPSAHFYIGQQSVLSLAVLGGAM